MIHKHKSVDSNCLEYGWNHFRLVTEEEKLRYIAAQLFTNYIRDKNAVEEILLRFGEELQGFVEQYGEDARSSTYGIDDLYVDHQSVWSLPKQYNARFTDGLIKYFKSPRVIICGGNDNDSIHNKKKPANSKDNTIINSLCDRNNCFYVREDGPFWTIFFKENGNKIRFSFDNAEMSAEQYTKSSAPELCDVSITSFCDKGCNFCYMSSTPNGKHAPLSNIKNIIDMLAEMQTFEMAIGGGEPTKHPDFAEILRYTNERHIVPNFTTFADDWISDPVIVEAIKNFVGGIGVSCQSEKDLALVEKISNVLHAGQNWPKTPKIMAQHVVGSVPIYITAAFLKAAFAKRIPVLLLGYKPVGFGETYERHDDQNIDVFLRLALDDEDTKWAQLSIDTALVNSHPDLIKMIGAPAALVSSPEGKFSCYVDAVNNKIGASSYGDRNDLLPLPTTTSEFKAIFATF